MTTITTTKMSSEIESESSESGSSESGSSESEISESESSESGKTEERKDNGPIVLRLSSFGYECVGQPDRKTTIIKDLRDLPSPAKMMMSNGLTGIDKRLRDDLFSHQEVEEVYQEVKAEIAKAIEQRKMPHTPEVGEAKRASFEERSIHYAFGCHRGKHRSVSFVERLKIELSNRDVMVTVFHNALIRNRRYTSKDYKKKSLEKKRILFPPPHDEEEEF